MYLQKPQFCVIAERMNKDTPLQTFPPHLVWLLIGLTLGWGINWPIMKAVLFEMAPMHFRTLCLLFGAAGLFTIARMSGLPIRIPEGQWTQTIAIALVNTMAWNIFAVYGVQLMASGRAAILGYTMPVWSVIIATWLLKEPFTKRRALGCVLGGAGLLLLLGEEAANHRQVLGEYSVEFLDVLLTVATAGTIFSYCLWTTQGQFASPTAGGFGLVYTIPFVLYGIFRYIWLVYRRDEGGAPEVLLLTDPPLLISVLLWGAAVVVLLYHLPNAPVAR